MDNNMEKMFKEALKDPMGNMLFLGMLTKDDESGSITKLIQLLLNHRMPFNEVGGCINDLADLMLMDEEDLGNDPESSLIDALTKNQNKNGDVKE